MYTIWFDSRRADLIQAIYWSVVQLSNLTCKNLSKGKKLILSGLKFVEQLVETSRLANLLEGILTLTCEDCNVLANCISVRRRDPIVKGWI